MTDVPLHPAIVHIPLGIAFVAPIIATVVAGAAWKGWLTPRAWAIVVVLQALGLAGGIAALRTGEADEHRAERLVAERLIEDHEHAAERFVLATGIALGISALGLVAREGRAGGAVRAATIAAMLVAVGLAVQTGRAGGELVYVHGAAGPAATGAPAHVPADVDD